MSSTGRHIRYVIGALRPSLALLAAVVVCRVAGPPAHIAAQAGVQGDGALTVLEIKPNFYMIAGAGGNVAVHVGRDGVIVTDTGRAEMAEALLATIRRLTPRPIRYLINTSADPDHVGGNATLSAAGQPIHPAGTRRLGIVDPQYAPILAEERVLTRMSAPAGEREPYPVAAWPTSTYSASIGERQRKLVLNGEAIQIMHQPAAHTDADSLVYFRRSDVLVTGDVLDVTRFPVIDLAQGGSIQGVLDSLNRIVEMTFASTPFPYQEDGTLIVPGHGRLCGTTDVVDYRDMVSIVRDRIEDLIKKGKTLEEIQQANPTAGYRRQYGSETGAWTTRMFVEAIYRSLPAQHGSRRGSGQ
jgi:glyoxylase-like metal-dependent hydrolase (beta-lactamase superfamily II)